MLALLWLGLSGRPARIVLLLLALVQAWTLPGWSVVRYGLAHLACFRARAAPALVRVCVGIAIVLDRCHAAEWSGQDCASGMLILLPLLFGWTSWRLLLAYLGVAWIGLHYSDASGCWGWLRPLPHAPERGAWCWAFPCLATGIAALAAGLVGRPAALGLLGIGLAVSWPNQVLSQRQTRQLLGVKAADLQLLPEERSPLNTAWLLLSNNPERLDAGSGAVLLRQTTPAGAGRVLASHINVGWRAADLVVRCQNRQPAPARLTLQLSSACDGEGIDAGSLLLQRGVAAHQQVTLATNQAWETRLASVRLNGIVQIRLDACDQQLDWTVAWTPPGQPVGDGPALPIQEGQSRGLFLHPDAAVRLGDGPGVWHWGSPWLSNSEGKPLLGNYGCCQVLRLEGDVWLVARGGVLGSVDGKPAPMLAAGQSRRLSRPYQMELLLPANSFAPFRLVLL